MEGILMESPPPIPERTMAPHTSFAFTPFRIWFKFRYYLHQVLLI